MTQIICHRGWWRRREEQNTLSAITAAFERGWGVETDLRDHQGRVVISHDPPVHAELDLAEVLTVHASNGPHTLLALNIKADGLAKAVSAALEEYGVTTAFVFDMSIPDHVAWTTATDVPTYSRWSDLETVPVPLGNKGLWLDAFFVDDWWSVESVSAALGSGPLVMVSPELHGRDPRPVWERLRSAGLHDHPHLALCTDRPLEAEEALR